MQNIILTQVPITDLTEAITSAVCERLQGQLQPPPEPETEFLTRHETAQLCRISLPTLNEHTKKGKFKSYRIGSNIRYRRAEVLEAIQPTKHHRP